MPANTQIFSGRSAQTESPAGDSHSAACAANHCPGGRSASGAPFSPAALVTDQPRYHQLSLEPGNKSLRHAERPLEPGERPLLTAHLEALRPAAAAVVEDLIERIYGRQVLLDILGSAPDDHQTGQYWYGVLDATLHFGTRSAGIWRKGERNGKAYWYKPRASKRRLVNSFLGGQTVKERKVWQASQVYYYRVDGDAPVRHIHFEVDYDGHVELAGLKQRLKNDTLQIQDIPKWSDADQAVVDHHPARGHDVAIIQALGFHTWQSKSVGLHAWVNLSEPMSRQQVGEFLLSLDKQLRGSIDCTNVGILRHGVLTTKVNLLPFPTPYAHQAGGHPVQQVVQLPEVHPAALHSAWTRPEAPETDVTTPEDEQAQQETIQTVLADSAEASRTREPGDPLRDRAHHLLRSIKQQMGIGKHLDEPDVILDGYVQVALHSGLVDHLGLTVDTCEAWIRSKSRGVSEVRIQDRIRKTKSWLSRPRDTHGQGHKPPASTTSIRNDNNHSPAATNRADEDATGLRDGHDHDAAPQASTTSIHKDHNPSCLNPTPVHYPAWGAFYDLCLAQARRVRNYRRSVAGQEKMLLAICGVIFVMYLRAHASGGRPFTCTHRELARLVGWELSDIQNFGKCVMKYAKVLFPQLEGSEPGTVKRVGKDELINQRDPMNAYYPSPDAKAYLNTLPPYAGELLVIAEHELVDDDYLAPTYTADVVELPLPPRAVPDEAEEAVVELVVEATGATGFTNPNRGGQISERSAVSEEPPAVESESLTLNWLLDQVFPPRGRRKARCRPNSHRRSSACTYHAVLDCAG